MITKKQREVMMEELENLEYLCREDEYGAEPKLGAINKLRGMVEVLK